MSGTRVASGNLFFFYAYDIGFDVALPQAGRLAQAAETPGVKGLRPVPAHLQYRPKPLAVHAGSVTVGREPHPFRLDAMVKIFDFGALSVTLALPVAEMPWEEYTSTALFLAGENGLEKAARDVARGVFERIAPAVSRPAFASLVEEYAVWHVGEFAPGMTGAQALADLRQDIARLLTLEPGTFSEEALREILDRPVRYYGNDIFLPEWNASFCYDPKYQDTVEVLEFLNVQMLELRFFDSLLHPAIDRMGEEIYKKRRRFVSILHDPYESPLRRISEFKLDVAMLRERTHNALKVAGDVYLARVYEETRRKVGAENWEGTIRDQLKTVEDIYTVLNNRAAADRAETLEIIIIVLILIEIVMGLFRH